mmetsp:Transcript_9744/g.22210  ORF Transcript_9744/g.22210 Transcript_9744/m.22210 type:complete len:252 (-) Transcript_9744:775-1530(-)
MRFLCVGMSLHKRPISPCPSIARVLIFCRKCWQMHKRINAQFRFKPCPNTFATGIQNAYASSNLSQCTVRGSPSMSGSKPSPTQHFSTKGSVSDSSATVFTYLNTIRITFAAIQSKMMIHFGRSPRSPCVCHHLNMFFGLHRIVFFAPSSFSAASAPLENCVQRICPPLNTLDSFGSVPFSPRFAATTAKNPVHKPTTPASAVAHAPKRGNERNISNPARNGVPVSVTPSFFSNHVDPTLKASHPSPNATL